MFQEEPDYFRTINQVLGIGEQFHAPPQFQIPQNRFPITIDNNPPLRLTFRLQGNSRMSTSNQEPAPLTLVDESRSVQIGNDKRNRPMTRLWVQAA